MKVFVVRHGTTVWNEKKIYQGHRNNRLSKSGIELVEQSAKKYSQEKIDVIYVSPVMRTLQTAKLMNKYHNVKMIKDRRLIDVDEGVFTGKCKLYLSEKELEIHRYRMDGYGMEGWQQVHERILSFVNDLKSTCEYENIMIVTHDMPATCIENIFINKKVDYVGYIAYVKNFKNAEVRCYKI